MIGQSLEDYRVIRRFECVHGSLHINTHTLLRKIAFSCAVILLCASALYWIYGPLHADLLVAREKTFESFTRAIDSDGNNSEYWWIRGRLRHYGFEQNNLPAAIRDYRRALSLNPRLGQAWVDLASCLEQEGDHRGAEESLKNALKVWTYSPIVHWQAGNYYLTHGNPEKMYRHFRTAIDYDAGKLDIALQVAWRADPDPAKILLRLVPDKMEANRKALGFFVARGEMDHAGIAWSRLMRNQIPEDSQMHLSAVFPYIDALLSKSRIQDAYRVWLEARKKFVFHLETARAGTQLSTPFKAPSATNLVWNGSFEEDISDGGFDWRRQRSDGADLQFDHTVRYSGRRSLRITFQGANIQFSHLSQIIPLPAPGEYRLQYYLRTENLTTDQKPYFTVESLPASSETVLSTEAFPGTSEWRKYSVVFKAHTGVNAVKLSLRRSLSKKFDSRIQGSLWLDDVAVDIDSNHLQK